MPLFKSKSKKEMPKDEMEPQKQSVSIAYDIMRRARRKKMAEGGPITKGYEDSQKKVESPEDEPRMEPESLQEDMVHGHPSDEEDRSNVLFDGKAERLDPLKKELDEDRDSDDIISRIMRKMRRKT